MKTKYLLILLALLVASLPASAYSFLVDGIAYSINDDGTSVTVIRGGNYTEAIDIPSSVTNEGTSYSVTSIGNYAFYECTGLTSVTIPNSVTWIIGNPFRGCTGLTSIVVNSGNTKYDSRNNCNAIIEKASNTLILGCKNTVIPNSVKRIGRSAFYGCTGLTSVTIPNSVTWISDAAFAGCSGLTSVTIGNSVTSINISAFSGCTSLTSVNISDLAAWCNIDFYNADANPLEYAHNLYLNGSKITNLVIPNSVSSIRNYAFYECTGLTSVTIPNSVTSIGGMAFDSCTGLTSVTIPNSVTEIGNAAFYECTGLTSVTIPNSVTKIGNTAFYGCTGLTSVTIGNSVKTIGERAFYNCTGLTNIYVDSNNAAYDSRDNCNAIIETATNTLIAGCMNTVIPNSVTSIGDYAFNKCSGLTSVTIPNSVTSIGDYAFYKCTGLTSVTIPNSVTKIGNTAFYECTGLTSVTIGNSVKTIGERAFSYCMGLENIYTDINPSDVRLGSSVFVGVPKETCVLHVKEEYLNLFKIANQWKDFYNIVGDYSAITTVKVDDGIRVPVGYYDMNGVFHSEPVSGVNIIKYNDGTFEKKLIK